jgi:uncharacterized protein (DUF433 family)
MTPREARRQGVGGAYPVSLFEHGDVAGAPRAGAGAAWRGGTGEGEVNPTRRRRLWNGGGGAVADMLDDLRIEADARPVAHARDDSGVTFGAVSTHDLTRITRDAAVMGGRPCIRGMRITVGTLVGLLGTGRTIDELLVMYPDLERDDVLAALSYAAWVVQGGEVPPSVG